MLWKAGTFGHVPSQGVVGSAITNDLIKGAFLAFLVARLVDLRRFAGVSTLVVATFGYGDFFCDGTALNCGGLPLFGGACRFQGIGFGCPVLARGY